MPPDFDALWDYSRPKETEQQFRALLAETDTSSDASYRAELLTQIARTRGLQGDFEGAHRILDQVDTLLSEAGPAPRIRASLERGRALNSSGHAEDSVPLFLAAWQLAREHGEDFHAIDAAHMLGIVTPPDEQLEWSVRALALAEASTQPLASGWLGPLYNNLGWTYHDLGRFEEALATFERSVAWRREQGQPRETRIAAYAVGRALRSLGRIDEALALQQETLKQAEAADDPDGYVTEEIGECLLALGRQEEARPHFARAYDLLSADTWLVEHQGERLKRLKELAQS